MLLEQRGGDHVATRARRVGHALAAKLLYRRDAAVRLGHQEVASAGSRVGLQPDRDEIGDAAVDRDRHRGLTDGPDVGRTRPQRFDDRGPTAEVCELHAVRSVLARVGQVPRQRLGGVLFGNDEFGTGRHVGFGGDLDGVDRGVAVIVGQPAGRQEQWNGQQ